MEVKRGEQRWAGDTQSQEAREKGVKKKKTLEKNWRHDERQ